MPTRPKFSEAQLVAFFYEDAALDVIAKRENMSRLGLIARWRRLQRRGRLPFERMGEAIEADGEPEQEAEPHRHSSAGPAPNYDIDGRSSVNALWGDDLLLEELFEVHHGLPGTADYTPALALPTAKYNESLRNRQQKNPQKQR